MKIRYILVDDDPKMLSYVKEKIDTIAKTYNLEHVSSYHSSINAYNKINNDSYDLLIVDFDMPGLNGIQLSEKIASSKKVVFLTSTTGKHGEIINNLDISGYMSKPFDLEDFETILKNKIIGKIQTKGRVETGKINLSVGDSNYMFKAEDAYYITTAKIITTKNREGCQAKKNYVSIYGKNDEVLIENIRMTISNLSEELKPYNFEKITQRTIINLSHVKSRISTEISLHHCEQKFEISIKEKSSFISKIASFFSPKR
ncbi:Transcriptional activator protein CopR [Kordia antarctica]|uniref:Transcriptional activator protein CopR n=1 Tax=Kordia antarctica TaxID=1218801 RepID=A0A7L4ZQC6_9FLAO|nr:response regulator [Kordia antarctica]QHI38928.1 Transcriptional activator protein CopR [Kordia antarctica]